jgi:hypothetical protein
LPHPIGRAVHSVHVLLACFGQDISKSIPQSISECLDLAKWFLQVVTRDIRELLKFAITSFELGSDSPDLLLRSSSFLNLVDERRGPVLHHSF